MRSSSSCCPQEKKAIEHRGTSDVEAYNLYLMARQYWIDGDFGDSRRERAGDPDLQASDGRSIPNYAQAWALMGLAQANLRYAFTGNEDADDGLAAANRALALDPHDRRSASA